MDVFKNEYMQILFDEQNSILELIWLPKSEKFTDVTFRQEFENWMSAGKKYKPKAMIVDTTTFFFPLSPENQLWIAEFHKALGVTQLAMVFANDIFAQVSLEQTIDKFATVTKERGSNKQEIILQYFDNVIKAREWILQ